MASIMPYGPRMERPPHWQEPPDPIYGSFVEKPAMPSAAAALAVKEQ